MKSTTYSLELISTGRLTHEAMTIQLSNADTDRPIAEVTFEFHEDSMLCSVVDIDLTMIDIPTIMHAPGFVMSILDQYLNDSEEYADIFFHEDECGKITKHRITHTVHTETPKTIAA